MSGFKSDSFAQELKAGIEGIIEDVEHCKTHVLPRWARLSFALQVDNTSDGTYSFSLQPSQEYSRGLHSGSYQLGSLTFKQDGREISLSNGLSCSGPELHKLGLTLREILIRLEEPPVENRTRWECEVGFDVPVAIFGMNYFSKLMQKGVPLASKDLLIYRSEEPASADLIRKLSGF